MSQQRSSRYLRDTYSPRPPIGRILLHVIVPVIGALCLGLGSLEWAYHQPYTHIFEPGNQDSRLRGLFPGEDNGVIEYAYSRGHVSIDLPQTGQGLYEATLRIAGPQSTIPVATRIYSGSLQLGLGTITRLRTYHVLIPPDAQGNVGLIIDSETRQTPTDRRELGLLIDWIEIRSLQSVAASRLILHLTALILMLWLALLLVSKGYWWKRGVLLLLSITLAINYSRSRTLATTNDEPLFIIVGVCILSLSLDHLLSKEHVPYIGRRLGQKAYRQFVGEIIASIGILGFFTWHIRQYADFIIDDTYISLVYVKNLLQGNGLTFNGTYVAGYSNFLWVIGVALLGMLGLDPVVAAKGLGVVCALLVFVLLVKLSRRLLRDRASGLLASALLATSSSFVVWSVSGLEALGFTLLIILSIYLILREEEQAHIRWSVLSLAGLALMRPEGIGLMLTLISMRFLHHGRRALQRELVLGSLIPCGIYLAFLTWHMLVYGYLMPTTVYAKSGDLPDQIRKGIGYLLGAGYQLSALMICLIVLLPVIFIPRHRRLPNSLLVLTILAYSSFIIIAGGDWMPVYRFLVPLLPLVFLLVAQELVILGNWLGKYSWLQRYSLIALFAVLALLQVWQASVTNHQLIRRVALESQGSVEIGRMMGRLAGPDDTIALIDAGAISYFSNAHIIDMVGLNDNYIAHLPGGFLTKYDNRYVLAQQPTFVQMHVTGSDASYLPVDFIGAQALYYTAEFHQWYKQLPESPYIFKRRATPLPKEYVADFYAVDYQAALPATMPPGTPSTIPLTLTNRGELAWFVGGNTMIIVEWHTMTGQLIGIPQHIALPRYVRPGDSITLDINLATPASPGQYQLVVDMERTRIFRFSERGVSTFQATVDVQ